MHESAYTSTINRRVKPYLRKVWKIKADAQNGVEDCYYLGDTDLWIEYKLLNELPKRDATKLLPNTSALQESWLLDHFETRQNAMVIVGVKKVAGFQGCVSIPFYNPTEWLQGLRTDECRRRLLTYDQARDLILSHTLLTAPAVNRFRA